MFRRITAIVTRFPKTVIALWAIAALVVSGMGNSLTYKATTDDTAQFLPKASESAQAMRYAQSAFGEQKGAHTVTMLVKRADGHALTTADRARIGAIATAMPHWHVAVKGATGKHREEMTTRAG